MKKYHTQLRSMILAALFLALAYVMPFLTGQIPDIGSMLCPMHIPILLCGYVCGWQWGLIVGLVAPLMRSLILHMPPLFPTAICMSFELAAYGVCSALSYRLLPRKKGCLYLSLILSMIVGRLVWGLAMLIALGLTSKAFTLSAFLAGAVTNALPGIFLQILLVPAIVLLLKRMRLTSLDE